MRGSAVFLLILVSSPAAAQEVFRWESKDGEVHYTDDRSTIPKGVKAVTTTGAELGVVSTGPAPRPVAPPPKPALPGKRPPSVSGAVYSRLYEASTAARGGRVPHAFELLAEAGSLAGTDSDRSAVCAAYGQIAIERLSSGQAGDAERFLRKGRELDPDSPQLRLASGELAYAQGDSQRALEEWERGLRDAPDDFALKRRIEEVKKASKAFGSLGVSASKWVTVVFDGAEDAELAAYVVKTIEDSRPAINALYGYTGEQRVEVVLYPRRTFDTASPAHPTWAGGLYDGRIHLATGGAAKARGLLGATLLHEYGHRVLARTVGIQPLVVVKPGPDGKPRIDGSKVAGWPAWLDEGMAQLAPAAGTAPTLPCSAGHIAPLRTLERGFGLLKLNVRPSYLQAEHAVEELIARHGRAGLPRLLAAMGEGASFEDAFANATGTQYAAFAEAFDKHDGARR